MKKRKKEKERKETRDDDGKLFGLFNKLSIIVVFC